MPKKLNLNDYLKDYAESRIEEPGERSNFFVKEYRESGPVFNQEFGSKFVKETTLHLTADSTFPKARSECLYLITDLKDKIKKQRTQMEDFSQAHFAAMHSKLRVQYDQMKTHLLGMIEKSFRENEAQIEEKLKSQGRITPLAFNDVYERLDAMVHELNRLENGLNSSILTRPGVQAVHH
jgi:hypothetical protein